LNGKDSEGAQVDIDKLVEALHAQITVVSIHLAETDDPYLIFESLNAKGAPLTQADLIRNYLLLRLHAQAQQEAYESYWVPMQRLLPSEHLTEFMRQFLMMSGEEVSKSEIYLVLKRRLGTLADGAVLDQLKSMHSSAALYAETIGLHVDADEQIDDALRRLRRLEMSVATPLVLRLLWARANGAIDDNEVRKSLATVESFVLRRMICRVPTNQMKRIFLALTKELPAAEPASYIVRNLASGTAGRRWPKDDEFREGWLSYRAYSGPLDRCRLVLETLERDLEHKEPASFDGATIEHVMPQTLTDEWRSMLGVNSEQIHERWLDTFGNLTLTGYNSELSNLSFDKKRTRLRESHFELNKAIVKQSDWGEGVLKARALLLFERAQGLWERPGD
jgi:hypothetical protein